MFGTNRDLQYYWNEQKKKNPCDISEHNSVSQLIRRKDISNYYVRDCLSLLILQRIAL